MSKQLKFSEYLAEQKPKEKDRYVEIDGVIYDTYVANEATVKLVMDANRRKDFHVIEDLDAYFDKLRSN